MIKQVTGVILAGGLARRMNQEDKGLVYFNNKPMISYAIQAMLPVVDKLLINANRNIEQYQAFNYQVVSDVTGNFDGPLAGIYAALSVCEHDILLVMPCDSPFMSADGLQFLLAERARCDADIVVAFDGQRVHPVFLALKASLKSSLQNYLAEGERKIDRWLAQHNWVKADFSANPAFFANINTLEELAELTIKES